MKRPRVEHAQELQGLNEDKTKEEGIAPERVAEFADSVGVRPSLPGCPPSIAAGTCDPKCFND